MHSPSYPSRLFSSLVVDVLLTLVALFLSSALRPFLPIGRPLSAAWLDWPVYGIAALIWGFTLPQHNLYEARRIPLRTELRLLATSVGVALLLFAGCLYISFREVSRLQFLLFGVLNFTLLAVAHVARRLHSWNHPPWSVVIVGTTTAGCAVAKQLRMNGPGSGVRVVGFVDENLPAGSNVEGLPVLGPSHLLSRLITEYRLTEVVLALPRHAYAQLLELVQALEPFPVQISLVPDVLDLAWFTTRVEDLNGVPLLRLRHSPLDDSFNRALKRLMDLIIGSLTLVVTAPLMLLIGVLIRLDSPGPALIKQERIGEGGRPFGMYKFRTMYVDAPQQPPSGVPHKRRNDPRVTRLGRWLRRFSLDELPQLFNVLKGEMSLVGPRPELPWLVERYQPWQRRRFAAPPGMTGWWQINGRSERPMHEHVEDDLYYIRNYSLWLDIFILLRTIPAVIKGRGAF